MKSETEMTPAELIERFEKDILYDAHSLRARISRSDAQKEIVRRRIELLPLVKAHIAGKTGSQDEEVLRAWAIVLSWMESEPNPETGETAGSLLAKLLTRRQEGASSEELARIQRDFEDHASSQLGGASVSVKMQ